MLTLTNQRSTIAHLNIRTEKHGDKDITAVDIKLQVDIPNEFLNDLAPGMLAAFYVDDDRRPDLLHRPLMLRYPHLGVIRWKEVVENWVLILNGYDQHDGRYTFNVDANKVHFECKEGGTVSFVMTLSTYPDSEAIVVLSTWLKREISVDLRERDEDADGTKSIFQDGDD
jgi:hypothetical protein